MSSDTLEIQAAIVAALRADGTFSGLSTIVDRPLPSQGFPYSTFGAFQGEPYDGDGFDGWECFLEIHTYSRTYGRVECERIMAAIEAVLHEQDLTLSSATFSLGRLVSQRTLEDSDGVTVHGIQRFRFITGT